MTLFYQVFYLFNYFVFLYVVLVDGFYIFLLFLSIRELLNHIRHYTFNEYEEMRNSQLTPPVSIIVPAYNEGVTIRESILSFLNLDYPEYEVIVVNDGSKDDTLAKLIEDFELIPTLQVIRQQILCKKIKAVYRSVKFPFLMVLDKENGGKADALNAGINASSYPYFCGVDADSLLEQDALLKTMRPFIEGVDNVVACGGIVRIANGCKIQNGRVLEVRLPKNHLVISQVIEYLRSFLTGRLGLSGMNSLLIISGAFGVFRKKEIITIGGYNPHTVGEDMELVVRLQKYLVKNKIKAKVVFCPDPVCWTEAPENMKILARQRTRWQIGLLECMVLHRDTLFNPRYKLLGIITMPYFLFVELLGSTIELIGFIFLPIGLYLGIINIPFVILFSTATLFVGIFLSLGAVCLEELSLRRYPKITDLIKLAFYSIVENFWYRQLNAIWKTWAFIRYFRKDTVWGQMERKGLSAESQSSPSLPM